MKSLRRHSIQLLLCLFIIYTSNTHLYPTWIHTSTVHPIHLSLPSSKLLSIHYLFNYYSPHYLHYSYHLSQSASLHLTLTMNTTSCNWEMKCFSIFRKWLLLNLTTYHHKTIHITINQSHITFSPLYQSLQQIDYLQNYNSSQV